MIFQIFKNCNRVVLSAFSLFVIMFFFVPSGIMAQTYTISSDDLPITLGSSYNNSIIQIEGSKISTSGSGITVSCSGATLDFGVDTLEFGTGYGNNSKGLFFGYNASNIVVNGGTILHGGGSSVTDSSWRAACIVFDGPSNIVFNNTNAVVKGWDGHCMETIGASKMIEINGGIYRSEVKGYISRCEYGGTALLLGSASSVSDNEYNFKIHNIKVENSPQTAIRVVGRAFIYDCVLEVDARNDLYTYPTGDYCQGSVQSWGVVFRGMLDGSYISNNQINAGSNYLGADGAILLEFCSGTADNPIEIYNNVCNLSRGRDMHYGDLTCKGLKYRWSNNYVNIHDNTFYIETDSDLNTTSIGNSAEGFDIVHVQEDGWPDSNMVIERNTIEVKALDNGVSSASGMRIVAVNGFDWYGAGNRLRNNIIMGSTSGIQFGGYDGNASNVRIEGGSIADIPVNGLEYTTFLPGHYARACTSLVAQDISYMGAASPTDITFFGAESDMTIKKTLILAALGNNDDLIENVSFVVTNGNNNTIYSSVGDSGFASVTVDYWYESSVESEPTSFNSFTIQASKGGENKTDTIDVNWDTPVLYFNFQNTAGTIDTTGIVFIDTEIDDIPPAAILDLQVSQ